MSPKHATLEFRKVGGFAGIEEVLRIDDDGALHLERSVSGAPQPELRGQLEPTAAREVFSLVDPTNLRDAARDRRPEPHVFDEFSYSIRYQGVSVDLGAGNIPAALRPLLERLERIVQDLVRDHR